jgi:hypothetical protein
MAHTKETEYWIRTHFVNLKAFQCIRPFMTDYSNLSQWHVTMAFIKMCTSQYIQMYKNLNCSVFVKSCSFSLSNELLVSLIVWC